MSTLLLICILAVATWLVANLATAHRRSRSTSSDSVAGFSRALDALDPTNDDDRPPLGPQARPVRRRQGAATRRQGPPVRGQGHRPRSRPIRARSRKPADAGGRRG